MIALPPVPIRAYTEIDLKEVMYYLYLPVKMPGTGYQIPHNIRCLSEMIIDAAAHAEVSPMPMKDMYVYVSARKGWATPDNPLNRPGWHIDGFGTHDLNYVWWKGAGTRFAIGDFGSIPEDHMASLAYLEMKVKQGLPVHVLEDRTEGVMYCMDQRVVHATPEIKKGQWRQYVKISISPHRYNLENNSHNYLFEYNWPLTPREEVRNDTHRAQRDYS